jgi:protein involved in sex pheromone biosynthesis
VQQGVITMASAEEKKAFEKKADINSKADAFASKTAAEEAKERKAKASKLVEA